MVSAKLTIPAPIAYPEGAVLVLNYKMRPAIWELGEVRDARYRPETLRSRADGSKYKTGGGWTYTVFVSRPVTTDGWGLRGGGYCLTVGDDAVKACSAPRVGAPAEEPR